MGTGALCVVCCVLCVVHGPILGTIWEVLGAIWEPFGGSFGRHLGGAPGSGPEGSICPVRGNFLGASFGAYSGLGTGQMDHPKWVLEKEVHDDKWV